MPKVLNMHSLSRDQRVGSHIVFVGRPSKWGNPFAIGRDGDRREVIRLYSEWITNQEQLRIDAKIELKGKDLVCYCAPLPCHGDILLNLANFDGGMND